MATATGIAILSSTSSHCVVAEKRVLYAEEQLYNSSIG